MKAYSWPNWLFFLQKVKLPKVDEFGSWLFSSKLAALRAEVPEGAEMVAGRLSPNGGVMLVSSPPISPTWMVIAGRHGSPCHPVYCHVTLCVAVSPWVLSIVMSPCALPSIPGDPHSPGRQCLYRGDGIPGNLYSLLTMGWIPGFHPRHLLGNTSLQAQSQSTKSTTNCSKLENKKYTFLQ